MRSELVQGRVDHQRGSGGGRGPHTRRGSGRECGDQAGPESAYPRGASHAGAIASVCGSSDGIRRAEFILDWRAGRGFGFVKLSCGVGRRLTEPRRGLLWR